MIYALGRTIGLADRAAIDDIANHVSSTDGGLKDLVRAVVLSDSSAKN